MGVDFAYVGEQYNGLRTFAIVANSGDDSISVFERVINSRTNEISLTPVTTIRSVPSPYAVAGCFLTGLAVVTLRGNNSVAVVQVPEGIVRAIIPVGVQPRSAACFTYGNTKRAVVSNSDNTLSVIDLNSLTVLRTISGVPAARGLHGIIAGSTSVASIAWVAGTDANVVTIVDLDGERVITQFPVRTPTAVGGAGSTGLIFVASAQDNEILFFQGNSLSLSLRLTNVPNPQDFALTPFRLFGGYVATTGSGNSIVQLANIFGDSRRVGITSGIPGAAAIATASYQSYLPFALVTSPDSNRVFLVRESPVPPQQFSVVHGASFIPANLAPGALASAFASTGVTQSFQATSLPLPTALGGVTVRVGGTFQLVGAEWVYFDGGAVPAALLFVGPTQVNFQIPPAIAVANNVGVFIERPDGTRLPSSISLTPSGPGVFTLLSSGQGQAAALNQDNSVNVGTNPARRGSVIQIFATGAGATDPSLPAGEAAPPSGNPLIRTIVQPTVTIGDLPARVLFSGMAPGFVGLWQINAEVPQGVIPGPAVPLVVTARGFSSNMVTIAVQ